MELNGIGTLVAGGASGLGEATARELAARGARVAIADLNEERGPALAEELGGLFTPADVTDEERVSAAVEDAVEAFGGLRSPSPAPASAGRSAPSAGTARPRSPPSRPSCA